MQKLNIPYVEDGDERHLLDLYLPKNPKGKPIVLVLHGGGLRALSKERMAGVSKRLTKFGSGVVTPNYRLIQHVPYPSQLVDVTLALEWMRNKPEALGRLNVSRIAVLGASAGAFLGQMLAGKLGKKRIRCLVSVSGPSDIKVQDPIKGHTCALDLATHEFPPTLITHNRNDQVVSVEHALIFHGRLKVAQVPVEIFLYERPKRINQKLVHGIWKNPKATSPVFLDFLEKKIFAFLEKWLE